ncbi:MAG: hypothetical protein H0Z18_10835 [Thermococcus sp.]|uniref:hypothetical protein n=1 Tax=Thermococcus sp. TaxID=35749 RepID=UPI001D4D9026|nr:hypothetical protein [Thermococcus sp.]MBO8175741.1 hypothetical protein [Thermococcus sp.]
MKKVASLVVIFLLFTSLGTVGAGVVKTFHIVKGQSYTFDLPKAVITIENAEFSYDPEMGIYVPMMVYYKDTGNEHGTPTSERGETDPDRTYTYYLRNIKFDTWSQTVELEQNEQDPYAVFIVKQIDMLAGKVVIKSTWGEQKSMSIDDEVWVYGVPKAKVKLVSIEADFFSLKAKFQVEYYDPVEADIVVEEYQEQEPSTSPTPGEDQSTNTSKPLDPTKVPTAMIVVGENAAGADVAAGAKVGIAVQKWIDIVKEKSGDVVIPGLGGLGAKLATIPSKNLNADAMLDTEVTDPGEIALIVYSVGGPAANKYSAMLNNRTDLPVHFVQENGKWYLVTKSGEKWSGSYGVIMLIPAVRDVDEFKKNLMEGNVKIMDVLVAGLDRWGTYAACDLLKGEFLKPVKDIQPDKNFMFLIQLQAQVLTMFADPFSIFEVGFDPTKLPITAIIVNKDGKIVKVVTG